MNELKQKLSTRKQLWEVDSQLLCSVCGTCLSFDEQRRLLRKLDVKEKDLSDYEIHSLMVRCGDSLNKISYQVDKLLNQKYKYEIARYTGLSEEEYRDIWEEHYARGDVCGLYWVAVTHRGLTESFVEKIFCDIHMLSHLNGGEVRKEKVERGRLEDENRRLRDKLLMQKRLRKEQDLELAVGKKRLKLLESKLIKMEKLLESEKDARGKAVPDVTQSFQQFNDEIEERRRELEQSYQLIEDLSREKESLSNELAQQRWINQQLYGEFQRMLKELSGVPLVCQEAIGEPNQCRRRILLVGGLSRLSLLCKEMVEGLGCDFAYHDGCLNNGEDRLKSLIQNVDMVLCSTDCNSHGACKSVKRICKRLNKDCCFLNNTSLSSIFKVVKGINTANPERYVST